jgi:hypothetical protein
LVGPLGGGVEERPNPNHSARPAVLVDVQMVVVEGRPKPKNSASPPVLVGPLGGGKGGPLGGAVGELHSLQPVLVGPLGGGVGEPQKVVVAGRPNPNNSAKPPVLVGPLGGGIEDPRPSRSHEFPP